MPSATNKTFDNPQMNTNTLGTVEWFQPTMKKGGPPTIKNHTVTSYNGYLYCFGELFFRRILSKSILLVFAVVVRC